MSAHEIMDMETRILETAKEVFVRKGYVQTSMSDIAQEVGIGRTALHYYFRTKEMLFTAIMGQLMDLILPNIKLIVASDINIMEKIMLVIDQYTQALQENLLFPILILTEMNRDPEHLYRMILKDPVKIEPLLSLRYQVEEEMRKGNLRKMDLPDLVSSFVGIMVFPILIRNPLTSIFMDGDTERFKKYIEGRTPFIKETVIRMFAPVISDIK